MFRFTIRDVLWLTVVVAVALAVWLKGNNEAAMRVAQAEATKLKQGSRWQSFSTRRA